MGGKAIRHGHNYGTIVSDTEQGVVLDVSKRRNKVGTKPLLDRFPGNQKATTNTITIDMWNAYVCHEGMWR